MPQSGPSPQSWFPSFVPPFCAFGYPSGRGTSARPVRGSWTRPTSPRQNTTLGEFQEGAWGRLARANDPSRTNAPARPASGGQKCSMTPAILDQFAGKFEGRYRSGFKKILKLRSDFEFLADRKSTRLNSSHLGISYA